jgi:hypothetical protein
MRVGAISVNPTGKKPPTEDEKAGKEYLRGKTLAAAKTLYHEMQHAPLSRDRIACAIEILNRNLGKCVQQTDVNFKGGVAINILPVPG